MEISETLHKPHKCGSCITKPAKFMLSISNIEADIELEIDKIYLCGDCVTLHNYFLGDHGIEQYM